jgi:hypothetical protein
MKLLRVLLPLLLVTFCLVACSDDDDDNTPTSNVTTAPMATVPDTTIVIPTDLSTFTQTTVAYDGADQVAYSLAQFIPNMNAITGVEDDYDARTLYAFNIASDSRGFSPRDKGYVDLTWDQLTSGYYLPQVSGGRTYFPSDEIPTAFDVKNAPRIEMYRRVDIIKDATSTLIELDALATASLSYVDSHGDSLTVDACNLGTILSDYISGTTDSLTFTPIDNYSYSTDWSQAQKSYLIPATGKAVVLDADNHQVKSIKYLKSINLYN